MGRRIGILVAELLLLAGSAGAGYDLNLFVLHSYHPEYPWTRSQHQAFRDTIEQYLPERSLFIATETLDTKRLPFSSGYQEFFLSYLQQKYRGFQPDILYTTDDNALLFLLAYRDTLFPGVPVFFSGVNQLDLLRILPLDVRGVFELLPLLETLALAQRLDPDLRRLIVVGDDSSTHRGMMAEVEREMGQFPGLAWQAIGHRELERVVAELTELGEGTVVLTTIGGFVNHDGEVAPLADAVRRIREAGRFRIYCLEETFLLPGVLGGVVNSGSRHGQAAAEMVLRRLLPEQVETLPLSDAHGTRATLDYRELVREQLPLSSLPPEVTLRHEPQGFYHRYRELVWGTGTLLLLQSGIIGGLVWNVRRRQRAERELREKEERLHHMAHHDSLTGLPNRTLFYDRLQQGLAATRRSSQRLALLLLDLDCLKYVNDNLGHDAGDRLLCQVAQRLQQCIRATDTVARIGGDEFVVILGQQREVETAGLVADKIRRCLAEPMEVGGQQLSATASIGVSLFPDDATEVEGLMKCADVAMYRAKGQGRDNCQFFRPPPFDPSL